MSQDTPSSPPLREPTADLVAAVTAICREADRVFERVGGGSRDWVRECFLPLLNAGGFLVVRQDDSDADVLCRHCNEELRLLDGDWCDRETHTTCVTDTGQRHVPALASSGGPSRPLSDPQIRRNEIATKLAELLAAHREGDDGSDCSDINDPGSCERCDTLDAAIKALSSADVHAVQPSDPPAPAVQHGQCEECAHVFSKEALAAESSDRTWGHPCYGRFKGNIRKPGTARCESYRRPYPIGAPDPPAPAAVPASPRAETGPMKFGDDWTGIFIRGDNAAGYAMTLKFSISKLSGFEAAALAGLIRLLECSDERTSHLSGTQIMQPFALASSGAASPAPTWHPISTAPKDGTCMLISDARFRGSSSRTTVLSFWMPYIRAGHPTGNWFGVTEATHWMPLPAPPGPPAASVGDPQTERE
jgi:hypothetical protein